MNGFSQCRSTWTQRSEKIKFNWSGGLYNNNGYLSMRKAGKPSKLIGRKYIHLGFKNIFKNSGCKI